MEIPLEISNSNTPRMISLITDFGNKDYYVASLKAKILNTEQSITIVDVSHEIETHDIVKAAFFINNCFRDFPKGSIHVVAVNNSYDFEPKLICFGYENHYFIGPNNGLFSIAFKNLDDKNIRLIDTNTTNNLNTLISNSIHHILNNGHIENLGINLTRFDQKLGIQAVFSQNEIRASVIHVDHYDNVIVNLQKEAFENFQKNRPFSIYIKPTDPIEKISESYAEVPVGESLCLFNEMGYLTIAINMGKASSMYSLYRNDTIQVLFY